MAEIAVKEVVEELLERVEKLEANYKYVLSLSETLGKYMEYIFTYNPTNMTKRIHLSEYTFPAGETYTYEYTISSNKVYSTFGVAGIRTGNKAIIPYRLQTTISDGKTILYAAFINTSSSAVTASPYVDVLTCINWFEFYDTEN